jgi:hypothetical protein
MVRPRRGPFLVPELIPDASPISPDTQRTTSSSSTSGLRIGVDQRGAEAAGGRICSFARERSADDLDLAADAGRTGQPTVAGDKDDFQQFGKGDVRGVVRR